MRSRFLLAARAALVFGFTFVAAAPPARAADDAAATKAAAVGSAAELLPPTTLLYVEMRRPADVIRLILDHPLRKRLEQSPDYQKAFDTPKFKEFQAVVEAVEKRSGVEWRKALETTTGGGLVVAVDAATQGLVVLARSTDEKTTASVRDALFSLARDDAQSKGNPDPVESIDYRGFTAHKAGESIIATAGPWLVVSNKPDLSKAVADIILDGGVTLARDDAFAAARKLAPSAKPSGAADSGTAWAFVRMDPVRLMHA